MINCHSAQCLRFHGHNAAYTAAPKDRVQILDYDGQLKCGRCEGEIK